MRYLYIFVVSYSFMFMDFIECAIESEFFKMSIDGGDSYMGEFLS